MDLLRFIALLPVRVVRGFFRLLAWALRPVFGNLAWSAPAWMPATGRAARHHPVKFAGTVAAVLVVVAAGWFGWHWWQNRPRPVEPERITFQAPAPDISDYAHTPLTIHPLTVTFSASAARLESLGNVVTEGIAMDPKLPGQWTWENDRTLRFVPANDWPVGRKVDVRFDKAKVFAPQALLAEDHFSFETEPFTVRVVNGEFYQDPQDPTRKKTIVQLGFNYPVDAAQLEKRLALDLRSGNEKRGSELKYTVTYDEHRLNAFVHSQPLELPRDDGSVRLHLDDGVRSSRGGDGTEKDLETSVRVPGLYSLTLDEVSATLVDNERFEPEQVVVMRFGGPVSDSDLAKKLQVWALPADDDKHGSVDTIGEADLRTFAKLKPEIVPTENDWSETQSFRYHARPGQRIYVRVDKGMTSFGGYVMPRPRADLLTVPDYPKLLRFMADGSLLSLSGDHRVSVVSRNMPGMRVEVGRVLPDQLQHLVSMNAGTFAKPELYSLTPDNIVDRFVSTTPFPDEGPGKAHYEGFDLGRYLASGKRGVFLLKLSGYDAKAAAEARDRREKAAREAAAREAGGDPDAAAAAAAADRYDTDGMMYDAPRDQRLIVITDLGVIAKKVLDGSYDIFVQSIRTGSPVAGASVSVVAKNGSTLFTQATGADGSAHFANLKDFAQEKTPAMFVVRQGEDLSFLPVGSYDRSLDFSRFDIGGEPNAHSQGQLSAYLFSDRGIYRPGDLFHIGMIVRANSWTRSVAGMPLIAEVVDPRGTAVRQETVSMDTAGFAELGYTTAETSPTGNWTVNLYIAKDGKPYSQIGSTTVQVKEFQPDRMKVSAKLSRTVVEGWVKPAQLKALVDVQNLFGTPAANRRVEGSLTLRPAFASFPSYKDYRFYDVRRAKEGFEEKLADAKTDDKGHAEFALDLSRYADATYQLYFLAKAYEAEGGRSVAAATQGMVSSNDWLVGYKAVDNLDYVSRDAKRTVNLVAIDPTAKRIELKGLKQAIVETRYVSVLTKQDSGVFKYESRARESTLAETPLTIPAAGLDVALPTDKPGNFALVVKNADGKEVNRVAWSVAGEGNVSRSLERNAELQLTLSKKDYAPGETVDVAIRAPYAGSGLITIERDKVYAHAWFHADTTSSVQHIAVPADFEGNGYINVQYVRDPSSDEIFMSPLSFGVVPFSVNMDARRSAIAVESPPLVKPGDTVTFHVTSPTPTRAVVFAVDEGILQVARYKLGDPLDYFFRKRMLEVSTSQILDLIIPDFEKLMGMAAPGGDAEGAIARQLNPFRRKRDKPVAYWSGIVDVDGSRDLTYTVPDYFNGKLRVMAVAVSPERTGTFEGSTTVRGDFVLSPNVPTTLAPGDEAEISVGVANNLTGLGGKDVPVAVGLKLGPQLQIVGDTAKTLSLGEMREGVAVFRVRATDRLGSGNMTFTASYGGKSARQAVDLSVRPASPLRTDLAFGHVDAHGRADVTGLRDMHDEYAVRDAAFSTVPVVLARGLAAYLVDFPHYCTEQVVSAAMPALVLGKRPEFGDVKPARMQDGATPPADPVAALLGTLRARQNGQGGFGLWTTTPDTNAFVTDYAVHYLLEAGDRGVAVPRDMLASADNALRQIAADDTGDSLAAMRQRAYAVYLLTRQGNVTTNDLASVQRRLQEVHPKAWKNDLAAAWVAASYKLLHQDKLAGDLIAGPRKLLTRPSADEAYVYAEYYDAPIRDATVLYLLSKHFPEQAKALPPETVENLVRPLGKGHYNTLSSGMIILALDAWAKDGGGDTAKLSIGAVAANGAVTPIGAPRGSLLDAHWSAGTQRLRLVNDADATAWYGVAQTGFDRKPSTDVRKDGLEIVRRYTTLDGKAVDTVNTGDEIDVHVRIRATKDDGVADVAIVDLLPGGFEPVLDTAPPAEASAAPASDDSSAEGESTGEGDEADAEGGGEAGDTPAWRSPIGNPESTWTPAYADVREDRVVVYGYASRDVQEFVYRIKATNAGTFVVPPALAQSLYDRSVQARAPGGGTITVERKP
ncbi:alpha-2-macroglobulin [Luteibacter yeojuensis]|uniref:Alpha-2-macroglobulin n=1 Tax=Luteibacter yeojuensis TaxID=345309 RepID=A0A7X5QVY5_9GAMM|nr:alpha-2-macroglobulin [Luteibacter yeojuensis]NID16432.1 alpha-2-macroglobulin [Luteibacter yeojuensis]